MSACNSCYQIDARTKFRNLISANAPASIVVELNPEIRPGIEQMAIRKYARESRVRERLGHGNFRAHTCQAKQMNGKVNFEIFAVQRKFRLRIFGSPVIRVHLHDVHRVRHRVHTRHCV